jgi:hypothetical protein
MTPNNRRRLEALEGRARKRGGERTFTAGLTREQCAELYGRMLREPPEPDLECELALNRLSNAREASQAYARMLRGDRLEADIAYATKR